MTIQLSVEEALAFQKFDTHAKGFVEGVQFAVEHFRRQKVNEIISARQLTATQGAEDSAGTSQNP